MIGLFKRPARTKSPLKGGLLRVPGQSLDEEIEDQKWGDMGSAVFLTWGLGFAALLDWFHFFELAPRLPLITTLAFLVSLVMAVRTVVKTKRHLRNLRLGRDGERAVGQYLEDHREDHWRVLHDIQGEGFNVDHMVICDRGLFVVETKTWSKPEKGEAKLYFDGRTVSGPHIPKTEAPIIQARSAAKWVADRVVERTGRRFKVVPIVAFPGWYVDRIGEGRGSDVLALSARGLPTFLKKLPVVLSREETALVSAQLRRMVREQQQLR